MALPTAAPTLDTRTPEDVYQACLDAAVRTIPEWAAGFPADEDGNLLDPRWFDGADPGLVLFKLFGELFQKLTTPLNGAPDKYALGFWDFMGITLRAARAAGTPVAFTSSGDAVVPVLRRTQVIGVDAPGVVFETTADLIVLPLAVTAAYAVDPTADALVDCSDRIGGGGPPFPLFGEDPAQRPFDHAICISDPCFDCEGLQGELSLTFEGANLYASYFAVCSNADGQTLNPEIVATCDTLTVSFAGMPTLPVGMVNGVPARWLRLSPAAGVRIAPFLKDALPAIYSVALALTLSAVAVDAAFYNSQEVDLKKGGQPFGAEPALQDAFYLASQTVFSRADMVVDLVFRLERIDPPQHVALAWEFWDGVGWSALAVTDGTASLTRDGTVTFTCPQIEPTAINDTLNYWIRARIADGGYGGAAGLVVTRSAEYVVDTIIGAYVGNKDAAIALLKQADINFGFEYQPASYTPPFVKALGIAGRMVKLPDQRLQCNGFDCAPLGVQPFQPWPEAAPVFYLGLDARNDAVVAGRPLTLLFATSGNTEITFDPPPDDPMAAASGSDAPTPLTLHAWDAGGGAGGWQKLLPVGADGQTRPQGILTVLTPRSFARSSLFGQDLYWLKVAGPEGPPPCWMTAIVPNVAPTVNAVTYEDVVIGSSTGAPDQTFLLPQSPILAGAVIEVLEPLPPTPALAPGSPVPPPLADGEEAGRAWIRWEEVANFDFSTPTSRHYALDCSVGALTFGNGVVGLVPPEGERNIRAALYRNGGGAAGNVGAGVLNDLQQIIPAIASVRNVIAATGGLEADTLASLSARAPGQIRAMDRAVTTADFATLALAASQEVAQAVCLDGDPALIRLILLPNGPGPTPQPSVDLRNQVEGFVRGRALPLLGPLITAGGPDYVPIDAVFVIVPADGSTLDTASEAIKAAYAAFFNPLTGGPDGVGWRIGARVDAGVVAAMANACPGVGLVQQVTVDDGRSGVVLKPNQLPTAGKTTVESADADAL